MKGLLRRLYPLLLLSAQAMAQDVDVSDPVIVRTGGGQGWSTLTGRTVGLGSTVLDAGVGWPGIHARLLHGINEKVDVGGRLTFNYAFEGLVNSPIVPGLKLEGELRVGLVDTERINMALNAGLGPFFYFSPGIVGTVVGLTIPIGLQLGIPVSSALNVAFGLDFPMFVTFGRFGQFALPILIGGGIEYFIDQNLAVQLLVQMGPTIRDGRADFTLDAKIGIAYRL